MTALQVIEQIKTMPPQELEKIVLFLSQREDEQDFSYAPDDVVERAANIVFSRHAALMKKLAS